MATPSYSFCATCIVRLVVKPSLREASCCSVEVVNGGDGRRLRSLLTTSVTCSTPLAAVTMRLRAASAVVAVGDGELFELLAVEFIELGGERLRGMRALGFDRPVFAGDEGFDLFFALHDHAQRRRLHAAGGQAALHFAPQHRRQVEADQIIQRAARLLGIDQVGGDRARLGHRFLDRARGDFGEDHALAACGP